MSNEFELGEVHGIVSQIDTRLGKLEGKMDAFIEASFQARTLWEEKQKTKEDESNWKANVGSGVIAACVSGILTWIQIKFA